MVEKSERLDEIAKKAELLRDAASIGLGAEKVVDFFEEDFPWLLAEVERLREEVDYWKFKLAQSVENHVRAEGETERLTRLLERCQKIREDQAAIAEYVEQVRGSRGTY
jgi:hypothetical protein